MTTSPSILRRAPLFALVFAMPGLVLLGACSSGTSTTAGTGGGTSTKTTATGSATGGAKTTGVTSGTAGDTGTGAGGSATCPPPMTYGGGETTVTGTKSATAVIVDETGAPIAAGQPLYICGIDICSDPAMTTANGGATLTTMLSMKKPAFKFGDTISYAEFAIPLTTPTVDFTASGTGKIATAKLAGKPGATLTPGAPAVSGDVTLTIPAGATVGIDTIVYDTPDNQKFRAVNVPLTNMGPVLDPVMVGGASAAFKLLYAVAPSETTLCPAAKVTVALPHATMTPNDLGWAPGTAVEFWIMTTDTGQTYAPYAGWAKMSDGVVSADGTSVSTVDGQGFILLENFAIRLKS